MAPKPFDFETLSSELLCALRGTRSQSAFARRLGYKSNIVYSWEAGRAFPTAAKALWAARCLGVDVQAALLALYRKPPGDTRLDPTTPEGVAQFLCDLRGRTTVQQVARDTGISRFALSRWFKAEAQPRLPDFLRLVQSMSLRLLDLLGGLVDPLTLPSVRDAWRELELARQAIYREPWSQAVLRALELAAYRDLSPAEPGWIAARLGIPPEDEERALALLLATGQIEATLTGYTPVGEGSVVDTRRDADAAHALRLFWSEVALERLKKRHKGLFSHSVFAVSEHDLQRIRDLQKVYYQEVRAIVAQSQPVDHVVLLNVQLLPLG